MPKRKRTKKYNDDLDHLMHKVRKLERKLRERSESVSSQADSVHEEFVQPETESPLLRPTDWFFPDDELAYYPPDSEVEPINMAETHLNRTENVHNPEWEQLIPIEVQQNVQVTPTGAQVLNNTSISAPTDLDNAVTASINAAPGSSSKAAPGINVNTISTASAIADINAIAGSSAMAGTSTNAVPGTSTNALPGTSTNAVPGTSSDDVPGTSISLAEPVDKASGENAPNLDEDILQILGEDPSSAIKYGKDIRAEIASRLVHVATEGITKDVRKDLVDKYLIPANCVKIGAPKLNPEIKSALSENFIKRDKGIESKQKEMASAISCLGEIISLQLNAKEKNNDLLQKLIDLSRILCDLQHADSVTRRNFILFNLKKDLKDHLANTNIDTSLFGENLTETLKSAKAVIKSGGEIKAAAPRQATSQSSQQYRRMKSMVSRPLNRRGPATRRPPPGPPPAPTPRGRAPAPRAPPPQSLPPPARYYRPSYAHQLPQRRY